MSKQINTTNWEAKFKKFRHHYECNLENDSALDVVCNCELAEIEQFIKDLLASSQKDKEKAVERQSELERNRAIRIFATLEKQGFPVSLAEFSIAINK